MILIFAGLLRLSMPSAAAWLGNIRLRTAAEAVIDGVNLARAEALRRNSRVMFTLTDVSGSSAWRVCAVDPAGADCDPAMPLIMVRDGGEESGATQVGASNDAASTLASALGTGLAPASGLPASVTFDGLGRPAQGLANLVRVDMRSLTMGTHERRLVVVLGAAGSARLCDPAATAGNPQAC